MHDMLHLRISSCRLRYIYSRHICEAFVENKIALDFFKLEFYNKPNLNLI